MSVVFYTVINTFLCLWLVQHRAVFYDTFRDPWNVCVCVCMYVSMYVWTWCGRKVMRLATLCTNRQRCCLPLHMAV